MADVPMTRFNDLLMFRGVSQNRGVSSTVTSRGGNNGLALKKMGLYCVCILFLRDGRCRSAQVPPLPRRHPVARQVTVAAELRDACMSPL